MTDAELPKVRRDLCPHPTWMTGLELREAIILTDPFERGFPLTNSKAGYLGTVLLESFPREWCEQVQSVVQRSAIPARLSPAGIVLKGL